MKRCFFILIPIVLLFPASSARAQNDSSTRVHKLTLKGYVKYLEQASFIRNASDLMTDGLIHNRLNFRYQPDSSFNFRLEVRNRLYYGDLVRNTPAFAGLVAPPDGVVNLSKNWVNQNAVFMNSTIDRASAEYLKGKWDVTIGRQRVNWGINTVWAPNDIFNTFNYFDFDYEERPGADAARVQYSINSRSSVELAASPGRSSGQDIAALMVHYNRWGYDIQAFSGAYRQDFTFGGGWAGNISEAGFKGEISYFASNRRQRDTAAVEASVSFDYAFKDGIYVLISGLYNGLGKDSSLNIAQIETETLSAKNIFPFKYTGFAEVSYSFTPILKAMFGVMYSPTGNSFILLPTINYSMADNWTLDLIGQSFFSALDGDYGSLGNSIFLRVKWSF